MRDLTKYFSSSKTKIGNPLYKEGLLVIVPNSITGKIAGGKAYAKRITSFCPGI